MVAKAKFKPGDVVRLLVQSASDKGLEGTIGIVVAGPVPCAIDREPSYTVNWFASRKPLYALCKGQRGTADELWHQSAMEVVCES